MKKIVMIMIACLSIFTLASSITSFAVQEKMTDNQKKENPSVNLSAVDLHYDPNAENGIGTGTFIVKGRINGNKQSNIFCEIHYLSGPILVSSVETYQSEQRDFTLSMNVAALEDGQYYLFIGDDEQEVVQKNKSYTAYFEIKNHEIITDPFTLITNGGENTDNNEKNPQSYDIQDHWAKSSILNLMDKDVIKGYEDGTFKPDQNITRAEFAQIINVIFGYSQADNEESFFDVKTGDWYFNAVMTLKSHKIISGVSKDYFAPNNMITRADMITILGRVLEDSDLNFEKTRDFIRFKDENQIQDYAKSFVKKLYEFGILNGEENEGALFFYPERNATRAEVAVIVLKCHDLLQSIKI